MTLVHAFDYTVLLNVYHHPTSDLLDDVTITSLALYHAKSIVNKHEIVE